MNQSSLHLVDKQGDSITPTIAAAVEAAFRWASREFPLIDPALLAHWAEEVGRSMQAKGDSVGSARRYAFAALHGKVRDWRKTGAAKEIAVGIGPELERWAGITKNAQRSMDRKILFDQLKTTLNERDRYILVLLLQDVTSPADVSVALGVSYGAAAKAIQRVKERIASLLSGASTDQSLSRESPHFCETKG